MLRITKCPRCGCHGTVRSHRTLFERLLMVVKPHRCLECQHRFLVFDGIGAWRRAA